jgi:CelD/BcsL family acetyltransferase involved in cellulose biosynthesis
MRRVSVEWIDDPVAFAMDDWPSLLQADPDATLFHGPRFLKPYWEEFGAGRLSIAVVRAGDRPSAVAPFEVDEGMLRFLGGFDVTDYMGPVGIPGERQPAANELMAAVATRGDWERADLGGLPEDGAWLEGLRNAARDAGLAPDVGLDAVAPCLPLPASFDEYLATLPGKARHEVRRKDRRLREAFPDVRLVDASTATIGADLDRFVDLHRSSPGEKGRFMVPGMELFFRRLAHALVPEATLRLAFLETGGRRIAGAIGFRDGAAFRLYNSAYDHDAAALAPGMVLVAELVRSAIEEGHRSFDFLKGDLSYKYRFGPRRRRIMTLHLRRPSSRAG